MPTPTLRLIQGPRDRASGGADSFPITLIWKDGNEEQTVQAVRTATELTAHDRADLQWYLEDYLDQFAGTPKEIPRRIETRMAELGNLLFRDVFQASEDARDLWARLRQKLKDTRIEIMTGIADATALPWELLQDPRLDRPLALGAASFVRVQSNAAVTAQLPKRASKSEAVRVLLVISRPGGGDDVPFRSVASRLVKHLCQGAEERVSLTVLRPPSFPELARVLKAAKEKKKPFHIVHFDGHGAYGVPADEPGPESDPAAAAPGGYRPERYLTPASGPRGFLVFESPEDARAGGTNERLVDGQDLGQLLYDTGVPVLVLNACRSAHADTPKPAAAKTEDGKAAEGTGDASRAPQADPNDTRDQIRTFGSLAQAVLDADVGGVIAMRYNVWVVTAAQFVAEFYQHFAQGKSLGAAATAARQHLYAQPGRAVFGEPVPLQDWPVPVVYEAGEIALFPKPARDTTAALFADLGKALSAGAGTGAGAGAEDGLPRPPEIGFIGRDETLLALDRAFDRHPTVLLHAYAGAGKTATAAEFARWYRQTGGIDRQAPILWDSFEAHRPLPRLIDKLGGLFGPALEAQGVQWLALDEDQRRAVALKILTQVPVLWVWDNVEPIAGFPAGAPSPWTPAEQTDLRNFLQDLQQTKAKVLLTSRRDERAWLGDLPVRVEPPPMPMRERREMAEALATRHNRPPAAVKPFRPLLAYTEGNPMTLTVVVGQALRDRLTTEAAVQAYVERLRQGEVDFSDDRSEARSKSLGSSLSYGFDQAFTAEDRRRLSLLHLFQGVVNADVLSWMGHAENPGRQPLYADVSPDAWIALLDRAADIGLLTRLGGEYYRIHPALPWFFRALFAETFPAAAADTPTPAHRAYAWAMGELGDYLFNRFQEGHRDTLHAMRAEEANLLHARALAVRQDWPGEAGGCMQGLRKLYEADGRWAGWARLVEELVPLVEDPATGAPRPGRAADWIIVSGYRVDLARQRRDADETIRLLRQAVDVARARAADVLAADPASLTAEQRNLVRDLGVAQRQLGAHLMETGDPACVAALEESVSLDQRIGDTAGEAIDAFTLGHAYMEVPALRDLDQAALWYQASLDLHAAADKTGQARCHGSLGAVAYARFTDARAAGTVEAETLIGHLQAAAEAYHTALDCCGPTPTPTWRSRTTSLAIPTRTPTSPTRPRSITSSRSNTPNRKATVSTPARRKKTWPGCSRSSPAGAPTRSPMPAPPWPISSPTAATPRPSMLPGPKP